MPLKVLYRHTHTQTLTHTLRIALPLLYTTVFEISPNKFRANIFFKIVIWKQTHTRICNRKKIMWPSKVFVYEFILLKKEVHITNWVTRELNLYNSHLTTYEIKYHYISKASFTPIREIQSFHHHNTVWKN